MNDRLGERAMSPLISIWDDGRDSQTIPLPFVFEGLARQRVQLVDEGVVVGPVYDRYTAAKEGVETTGHATPPDMRYYSGPLAFHLLMAPGELSVEEMKAIVGVAEDYGTYVLAHAYHDRAVNRFIDAGGRCVEHNFLVSEKTIKRMKKEGVALSIQSVMSLQAFHPDNVQKIDFFSADQKAKAVSVNKGAEQMLKWALKHDLIMVTGGDMFDKANVNRQIDNILWLKKVGFSNVQALKTATSSAGHVLSWSGGMNPYKDAYPGLGEEEKAEKGIGLGVVEEGSYADLLVINGNPLEDLEVLKDRNNMQFIMKDGHVWKNTLVPATHEHYVPPEMRYMPSTVL